MYAGIGSLSMSAGNFSAPSVNTIGTGKVSGTLDGSISVTGKSLAATSIGTVTHNSGTGFTDDGLVGKAGITVTGTIAKLSFAPLSLGTLQTDGLVLNLETVLSAPAEAQKPTMFVPSAATQTGSTGCTATLVEPSGGSASSSTESYI